MNNLQSTIYNKSLRTVFFGSGDYTIPIIQSLIKHGLILVVTAENDLSEPEDKEEKLINFLKKENIPFISSELKSAQDIETIKKIKPDLGILASYGVILPKKVLELFPKGIINVHPSLLPLYRGASPIQTALLNGDYQTGVTLHFLDLELDHGPIIKQEAYKLNGTETTMELKNILFAKSADMINEVISKIEKGEDIAAKNQDHTQGSYTKRRFTRTDGKIDIDKLPPAQTLDRMIRAFYPWPGVWFETKLNGKKQRVKLLPDKKIQVEGKKVMSYKDFVNGYGKEGRALLEKLAMI